MLTLLAGMTIATGVGDYFPSAPGTRWVYEEASDVKFSYTNEAMAPMDIVGSSTIPIVTTQKYTVAGKETTETLGSNFYRIEGDTVFLYATEKNRALGEPMPFLKYASKEIKWGFKGYAPFGQSMLPIEMKVVTTPVAEIDALGQKLPGLKQVVESKIDEAGGLVVIRSKSEAHYAKGIGMVSMTETIQYSKTKSSRKVRLLSFAAPK